MLVRFCRLARVRFFVQKNYDSLEAKFRSDLRSRSKLRGLFVFACMSPVCFLFDLPGFYLDLKRQLITNNTVKNQSEEVREYQRCLALFWYIRYCNGIARNNHPFDFYTYYPLTTPTLAFLYAISHDFFLACALQFALKHQEVKINKKKLFNFLWRNERLNRFATGIVQKGLRYSSAAFSSSFPKEKELVESCSRIVEMETRYRNLKIGHMYRLRRAYPRYSIKLGIVFLACSSFVCALCLHIIESAKGVQLKYMKSAFSDCSSPLAAPDFDMEALDTYAATNLLAKMIDNKPRLVSREKKKVLAHYVSRVTHSDTDADLAVTWLHYSPVVSMQYLFNDMEIRVGPIGFLNKFFGDLLFIYGVKFGLYPYFDEREQFLRSYLLTQLAKKK